MFRKRLKLVWYAIRFRNAAISELFDNAQVVDEFYRARDAFTPDPLPAPETFTAILQDPVVSEWTIDTDE
jgi:hypothetical protein